MLWCHVQQTAGSDSSPAAVIKSGACQIGSMVMQPVMQRQVHACLQVLKHRVMADYMIPNSGMYCACMVSLNLLHDTVALAAHF